MQQFDHEKLDVYGIAIDFVIAADTIAQGATRGKGHADLADQLRRASTSIVANIAEGAGEYASGDKARFYRMSKRSATECAALVEIYRRLGLVQADTADKARAMLLRIVSMLVRLVVATESGDRRPASGGYAEAMRGTTNPRSRELADRPRARARARARSRPAFFNTLRPSGSRGQRRTCAAAATRAPQLAPISLPVTSS